MAEALPPDYFQNGCSHYKRRCRLLAPCCNNVYSCHICHDQNEQHLLNRFKIKHHLCVKCNEIQQVNTKCSKCGTEFAEYCCVFCYMFDDNTKGQYHCLSCGICRVGGQQNYFHCKKCNMCLALRIANNHKCVENCSEGDCPLCAEYLHTSRTELFVPNCGHLIHKICYEKLLTENYPSCLLCKVPY
ncbi:hypothetical protein RN001_015468 [Aquatica leii]|uniref:Uncharacterized protein n=1 Tax=Aquatica leii TaxID=1421715 RepID=A0AAN7PPR1_9COLE|nr:hypothetical protein RN001_015468 [Aquatica leii]